ncbi:MAG: rhomboid-like protein [Marinosulfonomonas sp.]
MSVDDPTGEGAGQHPFRIRDLPFTVLFLAVMIVANSLAGTLSGQLPEASLRQWGISHQDILEGDLYRLITGTFLQHDFAMFLRQICFAGAVIGFYEWKQGTLRAVGMFFAIDVLGTLLVLFMILPPLSHQNWGDFADVKALHDVGMSAGGFGLIGAAIATFRYKSAFLCAVLVSIAIKIGVQFDPIADTAHFTTLLIGFALQMLLFNQNSQHRQSDR